MRGDAGGDRAASPEFARVIARAVFFTDYFGGCVISIAQIAAGRMYIDAR